MNKIKILYVDSQKDYAQELLGYLLEKEYDVKYINSLKDALIENSFHKPDLIITDINLIDGSGLELIKKIKNTNPDIKTFILTKDVEQDTLLETIPLKVDSFLFKTETFDNINNSIQKLKIKVQIPEEENNLLYDLGHNFLYEKNSFHIIKNENLIPLTAQENSLIEELIKSKGECVSYCTLQNSIGRDNEATIDTLRTVIRKIRKKTYSGIIENQSGIGYRICNHSPIDTSLDFKISDVTDINLKILIIKANSKKSELLAYQLNKFGFICEYVNTMEQAKEVLLSDKFDYIISDLNLPDGECIDLIRELEDLSLVKMIILSTSKDIHYKDYLYFKGILDYVIDVNDVRHLSQTLYKTILKVEENTKFNNVLVIEQSKRICEQIKDLLLPRNYNVDILNELTQAYDLIKTKTYSLVILDLEYESSFEFLIDVKSGIDKTLPFMVLAEGNRNGPSVRQIYKSGASECLRKPIYAEEFILKVDQLIDHSKLIYELMEQKVLIESYKIIVDQSAIISKTNKNGIITYVNEMFCTVSGYEKEELIGKPHSVIRHPESPSELFEQMWHTIKKEKKIWCGVIKNKTKEGSDYIVQTSIMPLKDSNGNIFEYIALRNDITSVFKK